MKIARQFHWRDQVDESSQRPVRTPEPLRASHRDAEPERQSRVEEATVGGSSRESSEAAKQYSPYQRAISAVPSGIRGAMKILFGESKGDLQLVAPDSCGEQLQV